LAALVRRKDLAQRAIDRVYESRPEEERFARQDSGRYSGWASAFTIAVIVLGIVLLVYYLK
jgi:hypothetical protein